MKDDATLKQYLDNPDNYIKNFEVGGKYNMVYDLQTIANCNFCKLSKSPIQIINGKIKDGNGWNFSGKIDYVIIKGEIKLGKGHSFISGGHNVDYAGELKFNSQGVLIGYSNGSGHYLPLSSDKDIVVNSFRKKYNFDISNVAFIDMSSEF